MKTLEDLEKSPGVSKPILPVLSRFQRAVFEKVQEQVGKVLQMYDKNNLL